jgi:hypothetical protein
MKLSTLFLALSLLSTQAFAHKGASNEPDNCRISVGSEILHFSAYTPTFTQDRSFCRAIPNIGITNLVFDYEGQKLRNTSLELEITRESDGSRVYHQAPKKVKSGTINASVDFSNFGAGDYLAHITINHNGKELDTHLAFAVGQEEDNSISAWKIAVPVILGLATFIFVNIQANKAKRKQTQKDA